MACQNLREKWCTKILFLEHMLDSLSPSICIDVNGCRKEKGNEGDGTVDP